MPLYSTTDIAAWQTVAAGLLTTSCTIARAGVTVFTGLCRVQPSGQQANVPGGAAEPRPRWDIHLPSGTDVRPLDTLSALSNVYTVVEVPDPRTVELTRVAVCDLTSANGVAVPPFVVNATVTGARGTGALFAGASRRVRIDWPTLQERIMAQGGLVNARLFDTPDAGWRPGDRVTISQIDGFTTLPLILAYGLNNVLYQSGPPAYTEADLAGAVT